MLSFNPKRLSLARRRRGLTRRALAEASGIPDRTVTAYENGDRSPPDEAVRAIARELQFPVGFFSKPDIDAVALETASFRALSRTAAARRDRALAGGELALELTDLLNSRFTLPKPDVPDLRPGMEPEAAAMLVRGAWALGENPISNLVWLLEAKGIRVFSLAEDGREVDAFSFWKGEQPFIFLNTHKSAERSRFDAAHELGHLVMHRHGTPAGRTAEREADMFASAFLMPRGSVLALAPKFPSMERLVQAKLHWRVSLSALAVRMHDIGIIGDWDYRTLMMELEHLGYRRNEPHSIPREMSQALQKMFAALREDGIGRHDLARMLDWPVSELDALVFELVLAARPGGRAANGPVEPTANDKLRLVD